MSTEALREALKEAVTALQIVQIQAIKAGRQDKNWKAAADALQEHIDKGRAALESHEARRNVA